MEVLQTRIPTVLYQKLIHANVDSLKVFLVNNETEVCQLLKLSLEEVQLIKQQVAEVMIGNKWKPVSDVTEWCRISTGCPEIDNVIRGGIPVERITEVVGPSGVGKTQFCLQLALTVQYSSEFGGLNKGVVYICTEDVFPAKRFNQLTKSYPLKYDQVNKIKFEDNTFLEHIADYEQLRRCLSVRLPNLLTQHNIGLIIIDSIAGVFRSETIGVNYTNRSQDFLFITSTLNKLAKKYTLAVVCINQVTQNLETGQTEPCLGLAWSSLITYRLSIDRFMDNLRVFRVVFAPDLKSRACKFIIRSNGICGVN